MRNKHAVSLANLRWGKTYYASKLQTYTVSEKTMQKPIKVNFRGKHWKTIRFTLSAFQDVKNFALAMAVIAIPILAGSIQYALEH